MATITIDGQELEFGDDERLNLLQAAERLGIKVPYYCWHPGLSVVASCRMCLVEVGHRGPGGAVRMQPRLVPACQTPARDGTVVVTNSEKVRQNRRAVQEFLLLDHPVDCPVCDQAGECALQDYYFEHGQGQRRELPQPFRSRRRDVGPRIRLFVDRCIMCSRCVRFTREVSGGAELQIVRRGSDAEIDVWPGRPLDNGLAGNVVDLCPVGALCSRDFLYQQRVWFLRSHRSVCPGCATGCSIVVDENKGTIYRLRPRYNPQANQWWMCDAGRDSYKAVVAAAAERLTVPQRRRAGGPPAAFESVQWSELYRRLRADLADLVQRHGGPALVAVLSPMLSCEEAWLLAQFARSLGDGVRLAVGYVPVVGQDERFPQRPAPVAAARTAEPAAGSAAAKTAAEHPAGAPTMGADGGEAATATAPLGPTTPPTAAGADGEPGARFIIRAEKCPNRRGVEAVARHFDPQALDFDSLAPQIESGAVKAVVLTGGYLGPWLPEQRWAPLLARLELLVVIDTVAAGSAPQHAHYLLPAAAWAEKAGSYVNQAGLLQTADRAVPPPGQARPTGRIVWELAGRDGPYSPAAVLEELAGQLPEFGPCVAGPVPEHGLWLTEGR